MSVQLAGCILLNSQNKIGLLHRDKKGVTQWELPGGKVEPNEDAKTAAVRELQEELGVQVKIVQLVGIAKFDDSDTQYEYTWFHAIIERGEPNVCEPDTFDDFRYFDFTELETLELSGNMKQLYSQFKNGLVSLLVE